MKTKTPTAKAIRAWRNSRFFAVEVECPFCPLTHQHGWDGPGHAGGYRVAHCITHTALRGTSKGYTILIPTDLAVTP